MTYAIQTRGLTKYYGNKAVVRSLDLKVPTGCVYGFLGRNGAGKSTTIKLLTGMIHPDHGEAEVLGENVASLTNETRARIAYIAEGHPLYGWMTINELERFTRPFYSRWNRSLFDRIIEHFELARNQKVRRFSNGQRAQISLALSLAPDPELLILDDPRVRDRVLDPAGGRRTVNPRRLAACAALLRCQARVGLAGLHLRDRAARLGCLPDALPPPSSSGFGTHFPFGNRDLRLIVQCRPGDIISP